MIGEFASLEELYERITPALNTVRYETKLIYNIDIKNSEVWEYLADKKWKSASNLSLAEMVNDILTIDIDELKESIGDEL